MLGTSKKPSKTGKSKQKKNDVTVDFSNMQPRSLKSKTVLTSHNTNLGNTADQFQLAAKKLGVTTAQMKDMKNGSKGATGQMHASQKEIFNKAHGTDLIINLNIPKDIESQTSIKNDYDDLSGKQIKKKGKQASKSQNNKINKSKLAQTD